MQSAIQLLVNGVAMGFIYCLIAIEYTLLFNTSGLINFGHDKYIMFGAYIFGGTFVLGFGIGGRPPPPSESAARCRACSGSGCSGP